MRQTSFFSRYGLFIFIVAIVCFPPCLYGVKSALDSMTNDVADWLPEEFPETATVYWFASRFGGDAILVVSWPDCTVDDERLDGMREGLLSATAPGTSSERLFRNVFTGRDTLEKLQLPPIKLSREEALDRMRGWLVGPATTEEPATCTVATLTEAGWLNRNAAVEVVHEVARSLGLDAGELRLGGPAVDSVEIDLASRQWLVPLLVICLFSALIIAWYCLRRVRFIVALFFYALFAWAFSLTVVSCSGIRMDAVLITMPALVYVLAVSAAVHMTGYYETAVAEVGRDKAPYRTIQLGWAPCAAAAVTTAFGVGSLIISQVVPLRRFGIFASIGVLVAVVFLFLIWPATIQCLMSIRTKRTDPEPGGPETDLLQVHGHKSTWWMPLFQLATRHWLIVLLPFVVIVPLLGYGVTKIRTSVRLQDLFSERSRIIRDYSWLESNIGPLIPVEVVLRFPKPDVEDPYALLQRLQLTERMRQHVHAMPAIGAAFAASTFLPEVPTGHSVKHTARRGVIARRILANRQQLVDLQFLYEEPDEFGAGPREELWRISSRVEALSGLEYSSFLEEFERYVDEFVQRDETAQRQNVTAEVSGGVFLVAMAQEQLLVDLKNSFLIAFSLIAVAMMVLTGSFRTGLISMIPNLFPALLAFGVMGWMNVAVDVGTMMSASVALGIAVDDASHFLIWLCRGLKQGLSTIQSIRYAYQHCANAMLATSVICGLGILAFGLSPFVPVARFACVMCALLFAALAGNLLLLSAILASPAGRFLDRSKRLELERGENAPPTAEQALPPP